MMVPAASSNADVEEPRMVHLVTLLFVASFQNRIVPVPAADPVDVLETVRESPFVFRPSIVTLCAPKKSINGLPSAVAPVTMRAPSGLMVSDVHDPPPITAERVDSS